jgi:hypothetical protein
VSSFPAIVSASEPSSTMTRASKEDVCSVSSWPASKANSVRLPPAVRASTRLAIAFGPRETGRPQLVDEGREAFLDPLARNQAPSHDREGWDRHLAVS